MASGKSEEWFADIGLDQDTWNALQIKGFDDLESLKLLEEDLVMKCFSMLTLKQQLTLRAKIKELKGDTGGSLNLTGLAKDVKVSRQHYGGSSNLPGLAHDGKVSRQDDGGSSNLPGLAQDGKVGRQDYGGSSNLPGLAHDGKVSRQDDGGSSNLPALAHDGKVSRQDDGGSSNLPGLAHDGKVSRQDDGGSSNLPGLAHDGKVGRQDDGGSSNLPALAPVCNRQDYDENPAPNSELRLVVFGKTGNGKSSTANTILGKIGFVKHDGQGSGTKVCKKQQVKLNGKNITIIDTPGVADALRAPEEVLYEITRCLSFVKPGPHALLFVINSNARFTQEEENAYFALRRLFAGTLNSYVIVVFTHFDELENNEEKLKQLLEDFGKEVDQAEKEGRNLPDIRTILADVSERCVSFSNTADKATTDKQVLKLLETIQEVADTNAVPHFEDTATQEAAVKLEKQINTIKQTDFRFKNKVIWDELRGSAGRDRSAEAKKLMQIVDAIGKQGREQQPRSEKQKSSCLVM